MLGDLDQISDYTGMGRLTWFPGGQTRQATCTSAHPQSREASSNPPDEQSCTKGVPGWGDSGYECGWLNCPGSTLWTWPCSSSLSPLWFHLLQPTPEHTVSWVTLNQVLWRSELELKLLSKTVVRFLCPNITRHRIHCESLISNTSFRKILLFLLAKRSVLKVW